MSRKSIYLWLRPVFRLRACALALRGGLAFASLMVKLVRAYKLVVSPWLPPACRFTPTCSEYAVEAIKEFGLFSGVMRTIARLLRCHPLHRGGFDPVN